MILSQNFKKESIFLTKIGYVISYVRGVKFDKIKKIPLKQANNDLLMYNKVEVEYEAIQKRKLLVQN